MGYYILQNSDPLPQGPDADPLTRRTALRARLEHGSAAERRQAVLGLVELRAEDVLTACLASDQNTVVQLASAGLWECWLNEAGATARLRIEEGISQLNAGDLAAAEKTFGELAAEFPAWPEAINKQATVLYLQGRPHDSIGLCRRVVTLKPSHFGAWNGMALCAIQVEDWELALQAVHESLRLQPRSQMNQQLLRLVETRLPQV